MCICMHIIFITYSLQWLTENVSEGNIIIPNLRNSIKKLKLKNNYEIP